MALAHPDRRHATLVALAVALWPAFARGDIAPAALFAGAAPPPDALGADVKVFTDLYQRMTAPVRINGRGPFAFVVDTGANRSVISAELAAQLSLPKGADEALNDAAGVRLTPTVGASLAVGGRHEVSMVLSVLPAATIGGVGMLGVDRLEGQRLTLDFHGKQLRIEGSRWASQSDRDVVVSARRRDGQLTLVDADLDGAPITAILDSGGQTTIGNMALHALVRGRDPRGDWSAASIISASGQSIPAELADVPLLRVGGLQLHHLRVAFADLHTFHLWDLIDRPAILLGVDVLSRFDSVALDFARSEVRFRLPA